MESDQEGSEMQVDGNADQVHELPRTSVIAPARTVASSHIPSSIRLKTQTNASAMSNQIGQLYSTIQLAQNRKVNAANAFEVDLNCLDNIKDFVHQQKDGNKWVRSGEVIDAGTKIYGFRVDNVH